MFYFSFSPSVKNLRLLTAPSSEGAEGGDAATNTHSMSEGAKTVPGQTAAYRILSNYRYYSLTSKI